MTHSGTLRPAEVFHVGEFIAETALERGWSIWDLAHRMGGQANVNVLALQLCTMNDPSLRIGSMADQLALAFGSSATLWWDLETRWLANPAVRSPVSDRLLSWYEVPA